MIYCQQVRKQFKDHVVLQDVSFQIPSGICALLGPNGAGKSTLLKILTGLLAADSGEAKICGLDVRATPIEFKRLIGVVPEDLGLFDSLTVREHFDLTGPIYGLTARQTRERTDSLLRTFDLDFARDTLMEQCSFGMRKRTALALALLHNPRVLFLDEPFEGVDPVASKTIQDLLASIARRGITVFLASHTLSLIGGLASEVMLIRDGRIVTHSEVQALERPLESIYFELIEAPPVEDLPWLQSAQS